MEETQEVKETKKDTVIELAEFDNFKNSIDMVSGLISEATLEFDEKGMTLTAMDVSNICMVIFRFKSLGMSSYVLGTNKSVGININDMKAILKRGKKKEKLKMLFEEDKIEIMFTGKSVRKFGLPILDLGPKESQKIPELDFSVSVDMEGEQFKEMISDAKFAGESMMMAVTEEHIVASTSGDNLKTWLLELLPDANLIISMSEGKEKAVSKFSTDYMEKISAGVKISNKVKISLGMNYPVLIEFLSEHLDVKTILAPRIDNN